MARSIVMAFSKDTLLVRGGRSEPKDAAGPVNPPVMRASTILFPTIEAYEASASNKLTTLRYGRYGTSTTTALETAVAELEGGYRSIAMPSGLAAIAATLQAITAPGDHLLMVDAVYGPTRTFCETQLKPRGIETTYYPPTATAAEIESLIRTNTRAIYCESPGSCSFEVQDIPAITAVAARHDLLVINDNTWASPYFFSSFEKGADVSIHAATKYIVGHSDAMLGLIVANEKSWHKIRQSSATYGYSASPDDCYAALRGLRTLGVRLRQHHAAGLAVAEWLQSLPEVSRVLHPALPGCPGHEVWKRDFSGASGLFAAVLKTHHLASVRAMINALELFGIGSSWGGYESLITQPNPKRDFASPCEDGTLIRLHVGLEDPGDLIADLQAGFRHIRSDQ